MKMFPALECDSMHESLGIKVTDTIPRASIDQFFSALRYFAEQDGASTFDALRIHLLGASRRKAPNTATAMWTVARDILTELEKLKLAEVGILPRKLSDVERLKESPSKISKAGAEFARLYTEKAGRAYDALLIRWLAEHPYFRRLMARLLESPLLIPDVTNLRQLGLDGAKGMSAPAVSANLVANCSSRMEAAEWSPNKLAALRSGIERRAMEQAEAFSSGHIDAKRLVDVVQDGIVLPAFLEAEGLPFDPVTFQHMLKCAQEFFCAAWTTSHPRFNGRIVFATCEYDVPFDSDTRTAPSEVVHHGVSYAEPIFAKAITQAYVAAAGSTSAYVSAYGVRAIVCVDLRIPLVVFARSLESLISAGSQAELAIYTELPFEPPPQGESYVEVGKRRIGRLKVIQKPGG